MNIFHRKKLIKLKEQPMRIYAPIKGRLKPLEEVDDMVFSSKMMGDGVAFDPLEDTLYSPVSGTITIVFPTGHVIGIESKEHMNIILHIGIDTVEMRGDGFHTMVKVGDVVQAGEMIMKLDLKKIQASYCATTMLVIENSDEFHLEKKEIGEIEPGDMIIKVERVST